MVDTSYCEIRTNCFCSKKIANQLEKLEAAKAAGLDRVLAYLALLGPYWALLGLTWPYWALLGLTGLYWALLGLTGPYWALLGLTGPY